MAAGHLTGNAIGVIETPRIFGPYLRDTQFKRIMAIASALLLFSTLITTYAVRERVLITARYTSNGLPFLKQVTDASY